MTANLTAITPTTTRAASSLAGEGRPVPADFAVWVLFYGPEGGER